MAVSSSGDIDILDHVKVIGFETEVLSIQPRLEEWEPWIQISFDRNSLQEPGRMIRFKNNEYSAVLQFSNWHLSNKKTLHGPYEIGELRNGEKVSLFIAHEFIGDDGGSSLEAHSVELQFMKGGEDEFDL
ncbi:hypothetical protein [Vibrio vulnificus]|uniref:hypothetical protein n=1 Tax=Vibrio vulnificus TaxID=672 RepID=UPI002FCF62A2